MYRLRGDEKQAGADPCFKGHEGHISIDAGGRKNGRGAYICPSMDCFKKAVKNKGLERSFKMAIPKEVYESLEKEMEQIGKQE